MLNENTDYFKYVDNLAKTAHIASVPIFESKLDFIPEITIAIPTYKRTDLLKEALDSALNQINFDNYEVIVVDNNPEREDETEKFMVSYKLNKRVSYYKNEVNLGMFGNWNRCFYLSKTKWVTLLHDDDLYSNNYLSVAYYLLSKTNAEGINIGHYFWKEKEYPFANIKRTEIPPKIPCKNISVYDMLLGPHIGPTGYFFLRDNLIKLGGFNEDYFPIADYIFYSKYVYYYSVYYCPLKLGIYRIRVNESLKFETIDKIHYYSYLFRLYLSEKTFCPSLYRSISNVIFKKNYKREIIDKKYGGAQYLTIYRQINYGIISLILRKLHECYFKLKRNF